MSVNNMMCEAVSRTTLRSLQRTSPRVSSSLSGGHSKWLQNQSNVRLLGSRPPRQRAFSTNAVLPAPLTSPLGIGSGTNIPSSYFQRPSLPANTIIRFVPQQTAWVVERMGKFNRILEPGLAILIPFIDRIAYVKSLKEAAIEIPSQSAITADNVTLELDGVLYTRVFDAYKASYGVEDAEYAISQLAQTTMRSEIGQLTLDHVLKERAALNINITQAINEASQAWGVVCLRYEIRDIHAPEGVVAAMHRQVTAERSKRAEILESEGQRQSAINIAEGRKQSVILASEALKAEQINMANGEAEAILRKAEATAAGIDAVARSIAQGRDSAQGAVSLSVAEKYVDAFGKLAKEGTAVVVPGNVGDLAGMIANAMAVYGKVSQGQSTSRTSSSSPPLALPAGDTGINASPNDSTSSSVATSTGQNGSLSTSSSNAENSSLSSSTSPSSPSSSNHRSPSSVSSSPSSTMDEADDARRRLNNDIAKSVLEGFEQTRRKR